MKIKLNLSFKKKPPDKSDDTSDKSEDLKPFWNKKVLQLSKTFWLPPNDLNFYNHNTSSWFSIKIHSQTIPKNVIDLDLDSIGQKNIHVLRTRKIKLDLTSVQKETFSKWLGTSRFFYNQTIQYLNSEQPTLTSSKLRTRIRAQNTQNWHQNIPADIKNFSIIEAIKALTSAIELYKKTGNPFTLKYRKKKAQSQSFPLSIDSMREDYSLYPRVLGHEKELFFSKNERKHIHFRTKTVHIYKTEKNEKGEDTRVKTEKTIDAGTILAREMRIQRLRTGEWYLIVPVEIEVKSSDNQGTIISLDPGVRVFLTGYDCDGKILKFGDQDIQKIEGSLLRADKIRSKMYKVKGKKRFRYRRAFLKKLKKIRNRIKDCHRKTVKYLVDNYDTIIIPEFQSSNMIQKNRRKIRSKTVRQMLGWSHYKFRMMLISKVMEFSKKRILIVREEYTSKTCSNCGTIKDNLGGSKILKCSNCGIKIDRDVNGARNIFLKSLNELKDMKKRTKLCLKEDLKKFSSKLENECPTLGPS